MSQVVFFCAICGSVISHASAEDSLAECPTCAHIVPVPAPVSIYPEFAEAMSVLPRGVLALEVKFRCPACACKLQIDARMEGRALDCPKCKQETRVPLWSRKPAPTGRLSLAEIDFLSGPVEDETDGASRAYG